MQPKKYTLLKHLPMCNAGTDFFETTDRNNVPCYRNTSDQGQSYIFEKYVVGSSSEWFELQKVEVIKVTNLFMQDDTNRIEVFLDRNVRGITQQQLIKIKEAIQYVFNEDGSTYSPFSNIKIDYDGITVIVGGEEYVSKKAVNSIRQDTWTAARKQICQGAYTFDFFEDYIKSIKK